MNVRYAKRAISLLLALALCLTLLPFAFAEEAAVEDVPVIEAIPAAAAIETAPAEAPAAAPAEADAPKAQLQGGALNLVDMYFTDLNRQDDNGYGMADGYLLKDESGTARFTLSGGVAVAAACELQGLKLIATSGTVYDLLGGGYCREESNHCEVMNSEPDAEEWHFVSLWMENVAIPDAVAGDYVLQIVTSEGTYVSEAYEEEWGVSDGYVHIVNEMPKQTKPKITTTYLISGQVDRPYTATLTADPVTEGDAITWAVTEGTLPEGFTLDPSGEISGTPTVGGSYAFTVSATEEGFEPSLKKLWLNFYWPSPTLVTRALPDGKVGTAYTATLEATPYLSDSTITWSLASYSGPLPDGLILAKDGTISGTPTKAGSFTFVPEAYESGTDISVGRNFTVTIEEPSYSVQFDLNGGTPLPGELYPDYTDLEPNTSIRLPAAPEYTGFRFTGWFDGDTKVGDGGEDYTVTKDVTLTAGWEELPVFKMTVESVTARSGETVDVKLDVANNPGIAGAILSLNYDRALTLTGITVGDALAGLTFTKPGDLSANPVTLVWDGLDADKSDGTALILSFTVSATAEDGDYAVALSYEEGGVYDGDIQDVDLKLVDGKITVKNRLSGDVNGDNAVNAKDVTTLRRGLAGGYSVTLEPAFADLNKDGSTNAKDVTTLRRFLAGGYGVELG